MLTCPPISCPPPPSCLATSASCRTTAVLKHLTFPWRKWLKQILLDLLNPSARVSMLGPDFSLTFSQAVINSVFMAPQLTLNAPLPEMSRQPRAVAKSIVKYQIKFAAGRCRYYTKLWFNKRSSYQERIICTSPTECNLWMLPVSLPAWHLRSILS